MSEDRLPPHSLDAEKAVLGAMILNNDLIDQVAEIVQAVDFYRFAHQKIFAHTLTLHERREPVDPLTLRESLTASHDLDTIGGVAYLFALTDGVPRLTNAEAYAGIVREKATLRELIQGANKALSLAHDSSEDAAAILDTVQQDVYGIATHRARGGFVAMPDLMLKDVWPALEALQSEKRAVTGVPSGLTDLDLELSGFQPADLIFIAARPSMGKTSLAMNMALHAATVASRHVGVFSLEMSRRQLGLRMLMSEARVDGQRMRTGFLNEGDYGRIAQAMNVVSEARLHIDDSAALTIHEVRNRARRLKALVGLDLLVLDYIQLMRGDKSENRNLELGKLSAGLKALAKELDIPVIVLSQLSRALEARSDKRPMLSDLRESGNLEQDADVVLFVYRDEVYNQDSDDRGIAELIVAKQRNGPTGRSKVGFDGSQTRFFNLQTHAS